VYDLYQCNENDASRFILGKSGRKILFVIGLNPSTANKEKSDTTVAKVEKVALNNEFDGFVMANLYPLRSTNPHGLPEKKDQSLLSKNIEQIIALASKVDQPVFWAAWGGDITLRPYLSVSLQILVAEVSRISGQWVNFGELRKDGHPRHPSRLSYSWVFNDFDCEAYVQNFA
jgi:hypothetical protein